MMMCYYLHNSKYIHTIDFSPSFRLLSHKLSLVSLADIVKLELGNFDKDFDE